LEEEGVRDDGAPAVSLNFHSSVERDEARCLSSGKLKGDLRRWAMDIILYRKPFHGAWSPTSTDT
jgi:hypothetical protein